MARLYRLFSPGLSFTVVGLIVLGEGHWNWIRVRGGLLTVGLYALALQVVLGALLIFAIDGLSDGGLWHLAGRRPGGMVGISTQPISFSRALVEFYRRPFLPAFLLGFGLGVSISAIAVGLFREVALPYDYLLTNFGMHRSEATLGGILIVGTVLLWWRGGRAYFGWVIGMCLAIAASQVILVPATNVLSTTRSWSGAALALCVPRLVAFGIERARHDRAGPRFTATGVAR
jgi:hypothetical protein